MGYCQGPTAHDGHGLRPRPAAVGSARVRGIARIWAVVRQDKRLAEKVMASSSLGKRYLDTSTGGVALRDPGAFSAEHDLARASLLRTRKKEIDKDISDINSSYLEGNEKQARQVHAHKVYAMRLARASKSCCVVTDMPEAR